jgi:hypothetical protein
MPRENKQYKVNVSFTVYVDGGDEHEAELIVTDSLQTLIDASIDFEQTDFHIEVVN